MLLISFFFFSKTEVFFFTCNHVQAKVTCSDRRVQFYNTMAPEAT